MLIRLTLCSYLVCGTTLAYSQHTLPDPARQKEENTRFYVGVEGILYANQLTQFSQSAPYLAAQGKQMVQGRELLPGVALAGGYTFSPRFSLEAGIQDLPILTGYNYEREDGSGYLGFGQSYTQDYLYVPARGVVHALGLGKRLRLSFMAGGGPAFTGSDEHALITPNGTQVFFGSSNGSIGSGPSNPGAGTTTTATVTLQVTHQATTIAVFEAGLRGSWRVLPHLHLDLTVRQLWSPTRSARDISLDLQTASDHVITTLTTPVQSLASGLSVRYSF